MGLNSDQMVMIMDSNRRSTLSVLCVALSLGAIVIVASRLSGGRDQGRMASEPVSSEAKDVDRASSALLSTVANIEKPTATTDLLRSDSTHDEAPSSSEPRGNASSDGDFKTAFARNGLSLADLVMNAPLDARLFFRSKSTNPRDLIILKPDCEKWTEYCGKVAGPMASLSAALGDAVVSDFTQKMMVNQLPSIDLEIQRTRLSDDQKRLVDQAEDLCAREIAARRGVDVATVKNDKQFSAIVPELMFGGRAPLAYSASGGAAHYADAADLPTSLPLVRARNTAYVDIAYAAVGFFVSVGCLDPHEADAQLGAAVDAIYARYPEK